MSPTVGYDLKIEMMAICMKMRNTGWSLCKKRKIFYFTVAPRLNPLLKSSTCMTTYNITKESVVLLEFDRKRDGIHKDVNLEDADEEETKMFKHLSKEVPEEADIWSKIRYGEAAGYRNKQGFMQHMLRYELQHRNNPNINSEEKCLHLNH